MPDNTGQVQEEYLNKLSQLEGKIAGDTFVASFSKNCEVLKSMCGLALVYENRMKQYTKVRSYDNITYDSEITPTS